MPPSGGSGGEPMSSCNDGLKNGLETGADCGGPDCSPCSNGGTCEDDDDCASRRCDPIDGVCRPGLVVRCRCTENCASGPQAVSKVEFSLQNRSAEALPLEGIVLRYYFTEENEDDQALCTSSGLPGDCAAIMQEQRPYTPATPEADTVLELQFTAQNGSIEPNATTFVTGIELRAMIGKNVNQLNDYSFYETSNFPTPMLDCERITLHRITGAPGGALIWGTPPQ
jgi:hypothetical protein